MHLSQSEANANNYGKRGLDMRKATGDTYEALVGMLLLELGGDVDTTWRLIERDFFPDEHEDARAREERALRLDAALADSKRVSALRQQRKQQRKRAMASLATDKGVGQEPSATSDLPMPDADGTSELEIGTASAATGDVPTPDASGSAELSGAGAKKRERGLEEDNEQTTCKRCKREYIVCICAPANGLATAAGVSAGISAGAAASASAGASTPAPSGALNTSSHAAPLKTSWVSLVHEMLQAAGLDEKKSDDALTFLIEKSSEVPDSSSNQTRFMHEVLVSGESLASATAISKKLARQEAFRELHQNHLQEFKRRMDEWRQQPHLLRAIRPPPSALMQPPPLQPSPPKPPPSQPSPSQASQNTGTGSFEANARKRQLAANLDHLTSFLHGRQRDVSPEPTHVELFEIFTRLGEESPHMQAQIAKLASASRLACSDLQALAGEAAQISQITEEPLRYTAGRLYHDTLKSFKSSFALEAHPPPTVSVLPLGGEGGFSSSSAATIAVDDKPTDGSAQPEVVLRPADSVRIILLDRRRAGDAP